MKYRIIDLSTAEKMKVNQVVVDYLKITCTKCNCSWGITLDPEKELSEKDLLCRKCFFEDSVSVD